MSSKQHSPTGPVPDHARAPSLAEAFVRLNLAPILQMKRAMEPMLEISRRMKRAMEPVRRAWIKLPEQTRRVQGYLANRGWWLPFVDLPVMAAAELARMIDEGRHDQVELELRSFASSRMQQTARKLETLWPQRWRILADAFDAHRQGRYTLSVPAMLIQADGISQELLGAPLFGKEAGAPKTKRALTRTLQRIRVAGRPLGLSSILDMCLDPLRTVCSLGENTAERDRRRAQDPRYGPLNRHAVLHGLDVGYDSEANGLRAILVLDYLASLKGTLDRQRQRAKDLGRLLAHAGPPAGDRDDRPPN